MTAGQSRLDFPTPSGRDTRPQVKKTIRIAVSGDVHLTELERRIIDCSDFQRLRGLRQLGLSYLVYPTALHTRFDHSLGVLAMTQILIEAIEKNTHNRTPDSYYLSAEQITVARLYALLHDITHVPFGHTLEDELNLFTRHDRNTARIERFLGPDSDIGRLIRDFLDQDHYSRLRALMSWNPRPLDPSDEQEKRRLPPTPLPQNDEVLYDIVSDTVCADLLDYLARDAYFCNLRIVPEYRFLSFIYLDMDSHGCRRPFIRLWKDGHSRPREDTLTDLTRLLDARYLLAERVYFHHAKRALAGMLGRALHEACEQGELDEAGLWEAQDDQVLRQLAASQNRLSKNLATRIQQRHLYKSLQDWELGPSDFQAAQRRDEARDVTADAFMKLREPGSRRELEDSLAALVGVRPGDVLLYALGPDDTNAKFADVHVLWRGSPKRLRDIDHSTTTSRLRHTIDCHENLWGVRILVPETLRAQPAKCSALKEALEAELLAPTDERSAKREQLVGQSLRERIEASSEGLHLDNSTINRLIRQKVEELAGPASHAAPLGGELEQAVRDILDEARSE